MKVLYNGQNKKIDWAYIEKLVNLQEIEGLHAGNKFKKAHLNWRDRPMKGNIAAQTLSSNIADTIDFCRNLNIEGFEDSDAITEFIRIIDRWFDILNSRNPFGRGYKAPLKMSNKHKWQTTLEKTLGYIKQLSWAGGRGLMIDHPKKTGFLGVIISSISIDEVFIKLLLTMNTSIIYLHINYHRTTLNSFLMR